MDGVILVATPKRQIRGMDGQDVMSLFDLGATSAGIAGVKAASLAKLCQAGFPVLPGIVVTTTAFARHLATMSRLEDGPVMRQAILSHPLHPGLQGSLRHVLRLLGDVPVAVRSSGVAEDLNCDSFAGQYDTFLDLHGFDAVEEAIRKCWASAFSDQIIQYRTAKQIKAGEMAVLIQPMVASDTAGVAFTANPVTGDRSETLVSSVRGLGERLVSGQAIPDEWIVRGNQITESRVRDYSMTPQQVLDVAQLGLRVEEYYGVAQEIEWAIRENQLYLLQARPITTLVQEDDRTMIPVSIAHPDGFWEREESHYPDPLMPLTRTTFLPAMNQSFRLLCDEMSMFIETLEVREIGGWIYQRVVPLGGKDRKAPPSFLMPLLIRVSPQLKARIVGAVQAIREDKAGRWLDEWIADWKPSLVSRTTHIANVDLHSLSDEELLKHLVYTYDFLRDCLNVHMKLNGTIQLILAEYAFGCRDLLGWDESKVMSSLSGLSDMSSAPASALARLAQFVQTQSSLAQAIEAEVALSDMQHRYPEFAENFGDYMREFGCRVLRYELAFPTIAETPETILRLLKDQLKRNYHPDEDSTILQKQRRSQIEKAEAILVPGDRDRFQRFLSRAEKAYALREEHGFYDRDVPLALLRYACLDIGRRLEERGYIDKAADVFFLEFNEAIETLKHGSSVREIIQRRQAERNWVIAHPGPASYGTTPPPPPSMASFPEEARLSANAVLWSLEKTFDPKNSSRVQTDARRIQGTGASCGRYTGKVRIIHDESEFNKIQPGDVLVCQSTSPVWSIVFPSIGALVTNSGGILSHSAIIAREYRVPAVVATANATELLKDGQLVSVDGHRGVIEVIS